MSIFNRFLPFLFLLWLGFPLCAQTLERSLLGDIKARNVGPAGMSGRVTSIDVVLSDPNTIYAGTASGGLWKSSSGGIRWEPVFDLEKTASIGAVAIEQSNPDVVWVGTGEGNPRNSLNGGYGVYKSLDGGKTWRCMGLEKTRHIHRIIVDPTDPDIVYVGAIGSPWGAHPERGVYKTEDGGKTWERILYSNEKSGTADLVMDPSNPNKLIASLWEHQRQPWFFNSGGAGSGLYITVDGGENWKRLDDSNGLPKGPLGRIGLAFATNKPEVVYALVESEKNALYRSEDGGMNWKKVNDKNDIGDRPFYYSDIYVDPENENRVYSIFTYVNVSEDGGKNFEQLMPAYYVSNGVHPDHHAWWIHPSDGQFMIDGNDGGLNITRDGGKSWRFIGNLPVAQFYHIATDNDYPYNIYGGMQDNGSWRGPAYVWRDQGIRNSYWQEISFGDGFDVVPDLQDSRYGFSMSQEGSVVRYDWQTGNNYSVRPTPPSMDVKLRFNWNAAIARDPFDPNTIYFGSQFVHKSSDKGLTWKVISEDLTTNDAEKQKQYDSGGITLDATGAENYCTLLVIEPSSMEKGMLWAGTDDGRVHYTQDGGEKWTEVTRNIKGLPEGSWIAQIRASASQKGAALLVANNYRRYDYTPYVFRTRNYGRSWERIVDEEDAFGFALSVIEDPEHPNLMFLGTDDGLYYSINAGEDWIKWPGDFPTVSTKDLQIHPREQDLVIGTFGRSAWIIDDLRPLQEMARDPSKIEDPLLLFPSPLAYLSAYQQPTGTRFGGDALYNGENRRAGAMITYYLSKDFRDKEPQRRRSDKKNEEEAGKEKDSIRFHIYNGTERIRTLKYKTPEKPGFHRIYWGLEEKGPDRPMRNYRKPKREPAGQKVLPGLYKVVAELGGWKDSTQVQVKMDPRLKYKISDMRQVYEFGKELQGYQQKAADALRQLSQSKKLAEGYKTELSDLDKKNYKEAIERSEAISGDIDSIVALYLGKVDTRQGIKQNPEITVIDRINLAMRYGSSRPSGVTDNETRLKNFARQALSDALAQTNNFFRTAWSEYQSFMQKLEVRRFREIEEFRIEE